MTTNHRPDHVEPWTARRWLDAEERRLQRAVAALRVAGADAQTDVGGPSRLEIPGQHPADVATETLEREVDLGLIEDFAEALLEIDAARRRIAHGTYGECDVCRRIISPARLQAVPATRWCRTCAADVERRESWRPRARPLATFVPYGADLGTDEELVDDDDVPRDAETAAMSVRSWP